MACEQLNLSILASKWNAATTPAIIDDEDFIVYEDGTATEARQPQEVDEEALHEECVHSSTINHKSIHLSGLIF